MIDAIEQNLNRGVRLLNSISDTQYSDTTVQPYHSSIGGHMRHILDVFDCIFSGLEHKHIDLTARKRNQLAEEKTAFGLAYFADTMEKLNSLKTIDLNEKVEVTDDLGLGMITANYTLASVLIQAHSHAIHHFASIGYIICNLGIELPDADFGYNPSTPRCREQEA